MTSGIIAIALLVAGDTPAVATAAKVNPARSVLIVSLPAVSWIEVRDANLPTLHRLLADSAIGALSTRSVRQDTNPANGYTALGAGSRSVASTELAGQNLAPGEHYGDSTAAEVFKRRTGVAADGQIGALGFPAIVDENSAQTFDAEPGALGRALREADIARSVIANADTDELTTPELQLHREAALALIDNTGRVPGTVTRRLLLKDVTAPFGVRLDPDQVIDAFPKDFETRRSVVLVEASDLARADAYRPLVTPEQRVLARSKALSAADALLASLLERVDLEQDAVLIVGPYHSGRQRELAIVALHSPGVTPGYLESSTTRRAGFLQIVDIAPTVLDVLGIDRPTEMEGRPAEVVSTNTDSAGRMRFLVRANREAVFRDGVIGLATAVLITLAIAFAIVALLLLRRGAGRTAVPWLSIGLLAYLVGTYVVGVLPFDEWGPLAYFAGLAVFAAAFTSACMIAGRCQPVDSLMVALGAVVAIHVLDALTGAHLELNTVFGYTPTVGIRLAGLGNPASAQLCAAALLLATLTAWRVHGKKGTWIAVSLLAGVLIVVGSPIWGQDFGGAISAAPAFALLVLLFFGRRLNVRAVIALGIGLVAVGILVGLADLARPAGKRTHIGRFFEKIGDEGIGGFTTVIGRKAFLMASTFSHTGWVLAVLVILGVVLFAIFRTDWLDRVCAWIPTMRAGYIAFGTLAVLGTLLNDSGVQVLGIMLIVFVATLMFLVARSPLGEVEAKPGEGSEAKVNA